MGLTKASPRYEVVSMRVTSEEKQTIETAAQRAGMNTSDALRDAARRAGLFRRRNHETATGE